jgi:hypothetical protein
MAALLGAHHSVVQFDGAHATMVTGVVVRLEWRYPHTRIYLDVEAHSGRVESWVVESESPILLERLGWTKDSVKPGDVVTTIGARARSGARVMRCRTVRASGGILPCFHVDP